VDWRNNPDFRPPPPALRGRAQWAWRGFLAAVLVAIVATGHYVSAAIYVLIWIAAELAEPRWRKGAG